MNLLLNNLRLNFARVAAAFSLLAAAQISCAKIIEEVIRVPVEVSDLYGKKISREIVVTLFHDDRAAQPFPLLLLNHGRAPDAAGRVALGRAKYSANASWFARLGFLVAVPTRIGYGATGGEDVEDSGPCDNRRYAPTFEAAATQTLTVLQELRKRADVLPNRAVVVGQSFGGATAVAVAAHQPEGVQAAINFAGGGGGNPKMRATRPCSPSQLKQLFKDFGSRARLPMLWLYTENDQYFGATLPREWFEAFSEAGGQAQFVQFAPHGDDGHSLFTRFPNVWQPKVLDFLQRNGYADVKLLPKEKEAATETQE